MKFSLEQNLPKNTVETLVKTPEQEVNLEDFDQRIKDASPGVLDKIWNVLKNKSTMAGMLAIALGGYLCDQAFHNEPMVSQNILEAMLKNAPNPDPEKIRQVLFMLKSTAVLFASGGGLLILNSIFDIKKTN